MTAYHFVISYTSNDGQLGDFNGNINAPDGTTRTELYRLARETVADRVFNGRPDVFAVTGFNLGRDDLGGAR